jgi:hypothetical protein
MRRRTKGAWIMVGFAALGAMMAGGGEAQAAVGITIGSGGVKPVTGDPPYDYIFQVYLEPGSSIVSPFSNGFSTIDSFTIDGLVGVTSTSLASTFGSFGASVFWCPSIDQTLSYNPTILGSSDISNVTWDFLGMQPIPITGTLTQPYLLDTFIVETTDNFPNGPPVPTGTQVNYSFTATDISTEMPFSGGGVVTLTVAPEPSSAAIVLLTGGTGALTGLIVRTRRRRKALG